MVNARDFGNGQTELFGLTLVWRGQLERLRRLERELATTDRGNPCWHELQHDAAMLAHELAERAAKAEVEAQRHQQMVAEEA